MTTSTLTQISDHVYWMPPGQPDRPSLCAVVGSQFTLMLDAGASAAHARLFLDVLRQAGVPAPAYVALTHWHWDHVFGAAEIGVPLIAHQATAGQLAVLAGYDWSNAALDQRVITGEEITMCAEDIKVELPEPRHIRIIPPSLIFTESLELNLGDVTCSITHVGGDHAADSCIMYIAPDKVLFLGDCLYEAIYTPRRHYTMQRLFPLLDKVLSYDAQHFVEGHTPTVLTRGEIEAMAAKMRLAGTLVEQNGENKDAILQLAEAQTGHPPDDDLKDFIVSFIAGYEPSL
ncbi:MAG: MBL fold metallo-hydrolase [Anaerolineae bacterium]